MLALPVNAGSITAHGIFRDFRDEGNRSYPVDPQANFSYLDASVVSFAWLSQIRQGDIIRWDWYDPQGNRVRESEFALQWTGNGWGKTYYPIDTFLGSPGEWTVRISLNGEEMASDTFVILPVNSPLITPRIEESPSTLEMLQEEYPGFSSRLGGFLLALVPYLVLLIVVNRSQPGSGTVPRWVNPAFICLSGITLIFILNLGFATWREMSILSASASWVAPLLILMMGLLVVLFIKTNYDFYQGRIDRNACNLWLILWIPATFYYTIRSGVPDLVFIAGILYSLFFPVSILPFFCLFISSRYHLDGQSTEGRHPESSPYPAPPVSRDVFISYAMEDREVADAICTKLESEGVSCWIAPRDILAGVSFPRAIVDAIDASTLVVLVFSSRSNRSPHVVRELTRAVSKNLPIIPFRIENVVPSKDMEYLIGTPHWYDAFTGPRDQHLQELANTLHILLKK
ncbi:MAG: toll/interleukin-1 receptor domain-containing protein [Methanomicrobiales archaeon]|nr:toll/interleukin-1 receptor domain-containing protein [Methanomicrobiales archaeon]